MRSTSWSRSVFDPGVVYGTIHTKAYNHVIHTARGDEMKTADACAAFHRYQLTWTPRPITIGADDHPYFQFDREANGGHDVWPFDAPQYLISTSPLGGTWGGEKGVDDAIFRCGWKSTTFCVYQVAHWRQTCFSIKDGTVISCTKAELARTRRDPPRGASEPMHGGRQPCIPSMTPQAHSPGLVEPEHRGTHRQAARRMSLEDKVGPDHPDRHQRGCA